MCFFIEKIIGHPVYLDASYLNNILAINYRYRGGTNLIHLSKPCASLICSIDDSTGLIKINWKRQSSILLWIRDIYYKVSEALINLQNGRPETVSNKKIAGVDELVKAKSSKSSTISLALKIVWEYINTRKFQSVLYYVKTIAVTLNVHYSCINP